jgi:hypothetical protein
MGDEPGPGPPHLFKRQLDPEVVAELAIVERSDSPRDLGAFGVVRRVVIATIIRKFLHANESSMRRPRPSAARLPAVGSQLNGGTTVGSARRPLRA